MLDIHGNNVQVGAGIYIVDAAILGSKSKRLLYGEVTEVSNGKCKVFVHENKRTYSKTASTVLLPKQ
jgi:hypothetical protein